jgi:5-methylcytosine-specific restriction endonuclease McrA
MAHLTITPFSPGLAAARVDAALRQAVAARDAAFDCALLWFAEIARRELYEPLGYPSLQAYALEGLRFTPNRFRQFVRLSADLARLPQLAAAVESGTLGWTKAQQVARVATPATEGEWVAKAQAVSRRELTAQIKDARASARKRRKERGAQLELAAAAGPEHDPPVTIALRLDGLQLARFEALIEQVRKQGLVGRDATREDLVLAGLAALVEAGPEPGVRRRTSVQVVVRQCPECEKAAVVTRHGERSVPASALEDAVVTDERGRTRSAIKPTTREKVLARDGHRCTGCGETRFLELHHVIPREQGGGNEPANLITLCSRCHRFAHQLHVQGATSAGTGARSARAHP